MDKFERLKKQFEFILEVDKLKNITRQTYIADGSRKENDTEHSWHLALMCMLLKEYAKDDVDFFRVMQMVIIHDIIEIDAGDTYAYDKKANESKKERELAAADRIFNILPSDQAEYFRGLWDEFEEATTDEALYALALDKIQPILLNDASGGVSWKAHGVKKTQIYERNAKTSLGVKDIWELCQTIIEDNIKKGNIKDE